MDRLTLTIAEFCAATGLGRTKVHSALNDPKSGLVRLKVGRRTLIPMSSVEAFLERSAERGDS